MPVKIPPGWRSIHRFTILRVGWEMDNEGLVVEHMTTGERQAITTNHGMTVHMDATELQWCHRAHQDAAAGTAHALVLLDGQEV